MEILIEHGTPEQKETFLKPLARGDVRSCFTMTEPEFAGSNPVWMGTTARKDGGDWVIRGHKWFSSGMDGSAFAICMAVTNPDADPHGRASMIIVPTGTPGFEMVCNLSVMGHRGGDWASHAEVDLPRRARAARATSWAARARASSSRSSAWARGASTTACGGSACASARSTSSASTPRRARSLRASPSAPSRSCSVDRGEPRRDPRGAADGPARGVEDRDGGRVRRARGDLAHQVHRRPHAPARRRPGHPGRSAAWE